MTTSAETPLEGRCACGSVRFELTAPLESARYCHCHNCQRRTGTSSSANARIARGAFVILAGDELIRSWQPDGGQEKFYCHSCGGHLYSSAQDADHVFIRLGAIEGDPGIRPEYRQWVGSAVPWETIPEDGLPRFDGPGHP